MDTLFKNSSEFSSLSLKDLVEARDLFHNHLMSKKNVVATALGLYRIRKTDRWPSKDHHAEPRRSRRTDRRTLFNSEVRPYSWPCVYVFVSSWEYESDLSHSDPSDVVPPALYLPDGRSVPVCVIEALKQDYAKDLHIRLDGRTPRNLLGPGTAILNEDAQGMTRLATAGCLARDGERFYVLTNRHAVGAPGTTLRALQTHRDLPIGVSADKGLTREDFNAVYPNFHSTQQRLLMDVGLIDLDDVMQWKTAVPGIAPIGPVLDLYDNSLSLKLITRKVVGQAAITGLLRGEIHGLFYRFKAIGGYEYLCDFLIGPETYTRPGEPRPPDEPRTDGPNENVALGVHHGDSGAILFIEHLDDSEEGHQGGGKTTYYPFALLWGKEEFFESGRTLSHPFALATSLSTALDRLNLDLVWDINQDQDYVWGWVGHYVIGRNLGVPTDLITSKKLREFIEKNLDLLAIDPDAQLDNDPHVVVAGTSTPRFVPLADVPDNVWKSNVNFSSTMGSDGKKHRVPGPGNRGQDDNANHFADLDLPYKGSPTFLQLCVADPDTYLQPTAWVAYFASLHEQFAKWDKLLNPNARASNHWGALPFRVHQLFDAMVKAPGSAAGAKLFLCAGGVLIHYLGDACQPLHTSYLSQGDPSQVVKRPTADTLKLVADGVHSGYEDDMIAYGFTNKSLATALKSAVATLATTETIAKITTGYDASKAVIALIDATQDEIPPREIVDAWVKLSGKSKKDKAAAMWDQFGDRTATCMARGTRYLAAIWQAAWEAGKGDAHIGAGSVLKASDLEKLYNDSAVLPSVPLDHYPDTPNSDWSAIAAVVKAATPGKAPKKAPRKAAKKAAKKTRKKT